MGRKAAFFSGLRSADLKELKEIEKYEQNIFKEIVQLRINDVDKEIKKIENQLQSLQSQKGLYSYEKTEKEKEEIKNLEKDLKIKETKLNSYKFLLDTIGKKTNKDYFLWDIDFIEVFSQKRLSQERGFFKKVALILLLEILLMFVKNS